MEFKFKFTKEKILLIASISLLIILLSVLVYVLIRGSSRTKEFVETNTYFEYEYNSGTTFYIDGKNYFIASKDGIRYVSEKGKTLWEDSYNMEDLVLLGEGNTVLVMASHGKEIRVYNSSGPLYSKSGLDEIITATINSNGYSGVITKKNNVYSIFIYANTGEDYRYLSVADYNVFPISLDISDDNSRLAFILLDVNGAEVKSLFNISYLGKDSSNSAETSDYGSYYESELISKVKYMKDNSIVLISDKNLISIKENGAEFNEDWKVPFDSFLDKIYFDNNSNIILGFGKNFQISNKKDNYRVEAYDHNGKKVSYIKTNSSISYLSSDYKSIIIGEGKDFSAYNFDGYKLWEHKALTDLNQLLFYKGTNNVISVSDISAHVLKLAKSKAKPETNTEEINSTENNENDIKIESDETKVDETKVDETKAEETKAEETKAEETKVE